MSLPKSYYKNDRYLVIIGNLGSIDRRAVDHYLQEIKGQGLVGVAIYIHESYFPTKKNEFGMLEPDFDKLYDRHGISEIVRRLDPSSPNYIDPYSLVRKGMQDLIKNISAESIYAVLFDGRNTPWADVEIQHIFSDGNSSADVIDISVEASSAS